MVHIQPQLDIVKGYIVEGIMMVEWIAQTIGFSREGDVIILMYSESEGSMQYCRESAGSCE